MRDQSPRDAAVLSRHSACRQTTLDRHDDRSSAKETERERETERGDRPASSDSTEDPTVQLAILVCSDFFLFFGNVTFWLGDVGF